MCCWIMLFVFVVVLLLLFWFWFEVYLGRCVYRFLLFFGWKGVLLVGVLGVFLGVVFFGFFCLLLFLGGFVVVVVCFVFLWVFCGMRTSPLFISHLDWIPSP